MLIHCSTLAWLGRRITLLAYTLIFVVGAVRDLVILPYLRY